MVSLQKKIPNAPRMPRPTVDLEPITSHLDALADTDLCPRCDAAVTAVMGDVPRLLIELNRLYDALLDTRVQSANRLAATRAALHADAEGRI